MNNYWNTNFRASQPGYAQFRYVLATHAAYDPAESARVGAEAQAQIEWHPVVQAPARKSGQLAVVTGRGVRLVEATVRRRTSVLSLFNLQSAATKAVVRLPGRRVVSAHRLDLAGRRRETLPVRDGALHATLAPRALLRAEIKCA
jgi:FAD/FMN-containing dehydrogenase